MPRNKNLYQLIVNQLHGDGFGQLALTVAKHTATIPDFDVPKDRLHELVRLGLRIEGDEAVAKFEKDADQGGDGEMSGPHARFANMDFDSAVDADNDTARKAAKFVTRYYTTHKSAVLGAAFSHDGKLAVTCSSDTSLKVLDVAKMFNYEQAKAENQPDYLTHPVITPLYDHTAAITCAAFHPTATLLASGSEDKSIKFFDYAKKNVRRAARTFVEVSAPQALAFHPSGQFLAAATRQPQLRVYEVATGVPYEFAATRRDHHFREITDVVYSTDGSYMATSSLDGSIKLWDGRTGGVATTILNAHGGAEIYGLVLSKNNRYILSSGADNCLRLWEQRNHVSVAQIRFYTGSKSVPERIPAVFLHDDATIAAIDQGSQRLAFWCTKTPAPAAAGTSVSGGAAPTSTGPIHSVLSEPLGHSKPAICLAASATDPYLLTGSHDSRARFWSPEAYIPLSKS